MPVEIHCVTDRSSGATESFKNHMNPHIQRAQMLYSRSRYTDAERELGMALQVDPQEPWAYAILGACRAAQDDFVKAEELGRQAMALAPDSADIRHLVARIQLARNDLPAAMRTISEAIKFDPHDARYYATRANVYAQQKAWNKALADCDSALAIDPELVEAVNVRAHARRAKGDGQAAAADLEQALQLDPDDAYSHANLGWTHLQRGQLADAERHFREALRLDPDLEPARVGVLETLKAKVPFYRWILGYFLWMQTKVASVQWAVIIGLYVAYRVVGNLANNRPELAPLLMPLIVLYLLFVLATWFSKPLADTALLLHPFGRLALKRKEKWEGLITTGLIAIVVGLAIAGMWFDQFAYVGLAFLIGVPALPLAMSFKFDHPKPRRILQATSVVLLLAGCVLLTDAVSDVWSALLPKQFHATLMSGLVSLFGWSVLLTLIGTNLLATTEWRR
jgi:Tfp pilus assembly protein PilF